MKLVVLMVAITIALDAGVAALMAMDFHHDSRHEGGNHQAHGGGHVDSGFVDGDGGHH